MKTKEPSKVQRETTSAKTNHHGVLQEKQADTTEMMTEKQGQQNPYAKFLFTFTF